MRQQVPSICERDHHRVPVDARRGRRLHGHAAINREQLRRARAGTRAPEKPVRPDGGAGDVAEEVVIDGIAARAGHFALNECRAGPSAVRETDAIGRGVGAGDGNRGGAVDCGGDEA